MNQKHLGDALDHWKGSVIKLLDAVLRDVHVIPMFTDKDPAATWSEAHLRLYARLLRVEPDRILHCRTRFRAADRTAYFSSLRLPADADVFIDPDNGVASDGAGTAKHVRPSELAMLLPPGSPRIALVYQHAFRTSDYVQASLRRLADGPSLAGAATFGYHAGAVAMLFVSRDRSRLGRVYNALSDLLAGTGRVTPMRDVRLSSS